MGKQMKKIKPQPGVSDITGSPVVVCCGFCAMPEPGIKIAFPGEANGMLCFINYCSNCGAILGSGLTPIPKDSSIISMPGGFGV
ncbi:MAG: hypothetical protein KAR42_17585 [candidate division Zixibacteria bacterium]|nr:hypothetical protein [candidate division Zixibacteria bacterium]